MRANSVETWVGAAVVLMAIAFFALAFRPEMGRNANGGYDLQASFASAEGIKIGSDVRMAGIKIGTISKMELNPLSYQADVSVNVDPKFLIPSDSEIKISSEGLLGGYFIEIVPGADAQTMVSGDKFQFVNSSLSLIELLAKFATGGKE